ncbi:hypothetical protein GW17_00047908 [Ensete ventricosum]|nr:hypothetical protein GW17_00047908 [Ensete ventricosum]RZS07985.1 hypothetical protein BHM03_00038908 [Ensete ventricosum]
MVVLVRRREFSMGEHKIAPEDIRWVDVEPVMSNPSGRHGTGPGKRQLSGLGGIVPCTGHGVKDSMVGSSKHFFFRTVKVQDGDHIAGDGNGTTGCRGEDDDNCINHSTRRKPNIAVACNNVHGKSHAQKIYGGDAVLCDLPFDPKGIKYSFTGTLFLTMSTVFEWMHQPIEANSESKDCIGGDDSRFF